MKRLNFFYKKIKPDVLLERVFEFCEVVYTKVNKQIHKTDCINMLINYIIPEMCQISKNTLKRKLTILVCKLILMHSCSQPIFHR